MAADDSALVGAGQSVSINVVANDTDVNGNLDPASVAIVSPPTAGTATPNPDGTVTYTNADTAAASDSFTYTVADTTAPTPLVSNVATVTIQILPGVCTAPCDLSQTVQVQVIGADMTPSQGGRW